MYYHQPKNTDISMLNSSLSELNSEFGKNNLSNNISLKDYKDGIYYTFPTDGYLWVWLNGTTSIPNASLAYAIKSCTTGNTIISEYYTSGAGGSNRPPQTPIFVKKGMQFTITRLNASEYDVGFMKFE